MKFDIQKFLDYGIESSVVDKSAVFIKFENEAQKAEFTRQLEIYDPSIGTEMLYRTDLQCMNTIFVYHKRRRAVFYGSLKDEFTAIDKLITDDGFSFIPASSLYKIDASTEDILNILNL